MAHIESDNVCTALKEPGGGTVKSMLGPPGTEVVPIHTPVTHSQPIGIGWEVLLKILANGTQFHVIILETFFADRFLNQGISCNHSHQRMLYIHIT